MRIVFRPVHAAALAGAACALWVPGSVLPRELPMEKALPLALAADAAQAAVDRCGDQGYRVSAAIVDRHGNLKVLLRGDGAAPHTLDSSTKKAYTAASLRRSTADYAKLVAEEPAVAGLRDMNDKILLLGGGLPITAGNDVVGGIGVGGAPGANLDEACARVGIERVKDRLK